LDIAAAAKEKGVKVVVCHTMRYAPFTMRLKEILDSGVIGKIMSVVHNENVGHIHQSHSFVRGNWGNSVASSPMILAKSCHDLDFLQWLIGKKCISLSSYGALSYFNRANVPSDAPPRCTDGCTVDCIYDTRKLYMKEKGDWFRSAAAGYFNADDEAVEAALKTGPYGRCVYQCDNDVVDHQVVSMLFEEEITVIFSMCAFTPDISRSVKIMGTKGQIRAHTKQKAIQVTRFDTGEENLYDIVSEGGHGGGDTGIMQAFCGYVRGKDVPNISEAWISAQNHMLCFAAEESRIKNGERIILEDYIRAAASA
jgi:predicted dehydrogenase